MVGITDSRFKAGEPCWIVINNNPREFYLGEFIGPLTHEYEISLWEYSFLKKHLEMYPTEDLRKKVSSPQIKPVRARLIDPRVELKPVQDGMPFLGEPLCNYAVLPYQEGKTYMKAHSPGQFQDLEQALYQLTSRNFK